MEYYENNPRTITTKQFKRLQDTLYRLGDLSGIVHDINSNQIVGGNQRVRALNLLDHEPVIERVYVEPTRTGTIKEGYYEIEGEHYSYRAVVWKPEQCEEANIAANIVGGDWDFDILSGWEPVQLKDWGFDAEKLTAWNNNAANVRLMQEADYQFTPGVPANIGAVQYDEGDMQKESDRLDNQYANSPDYVRVTCPGCAHDFYINKNDVVK